MRGLLSLMLAIPLVVGCGDAAKDDDDDDWTDEDSADGGWGSTGGESGGGSSTGDTDGGSSTGDTDGADDGGSDDGGSDDGGTDDGGTDDTGTGTESAASDPRFDEFINVVDLPSGDFSCFTGSLQIEEAATGCVAQRSLLGSVRDFQEDSPVGEATVEFFWDNTLTSAPDEVLTSDGDGNLLVEADTCSAFSYRVTTDPAVGATKTTIDTHDVLPHMGPVNPISHLLSSVSSTTYTLIPALLGEVPDPSKGMVTGLAYDCEIHRIEGLQVVVDDGFGNIPDGVMAKYFVDEFPNRAQAHTSDDGLWMLLDVPVGDWVVSGYVADGAGGHILVGKAPISVVADSINISSVYTGIEDGIKMPSQCLSSCG